MFIEDCLRKSSKFQAKNIFRTWKCIYIVFILAIYQQIHEEPPLYVGGFQVKYKTKKQCF